MATEATGKLFSDYNQKMAFVVGFTGECGKELVRELLQRKVFKKLVLIGRRQVQLDGELYQDVEQRPIDFDNIDQHKAAFANCEVGYCCLGTTRGKSGADGFVKIEHDYVVGVAKAAHEQGCKHFAVVSSQGANKNSFLLYAKTKGLMEQHVAEIGFERFTVFRPGFLVCDRQQVGIPERLAGCVLKPIVWAKPTLLSVPTKTVGKAMVADLYRKTSNKVDFIENAAIHELAKEI